MGAKKRKQQALQKIAKQEMLAISLLPTEQAVQAMLDMPDLPYSKSGPSINDRINIGPFAIFAIRGELYRGWAVM